MPLDTRGRLDRAGSELLVHEAPLGEDDPELARPAVGRGVHLADEPTAQLLAQLLEVRAAEVCARGAIALSARSRPSLAPLPPRSCVPASCVLAAEGKKLPSGKPGSPGSLNISCAIAVSAFSASTCVAQPSSFFRHCVTYSVR